MPHMLLCFAEDIDIIEIDCLAVKIRVDLHQRQTEYTIAGRQHESNNDVGSDSDVMLGGQKFETVDLIMMLFAGLTRLAAGYGGHRTVER